MSSLHILQVFPTFAPGGAQVRFTRLANAFGSAISYTILAMDGNFAAASLLNPEISVNLIRPATRRFPQSVLDLRRTIAKLRPDLVVTNNWGSMDAVLAGIIARTCPVIHSEDGFGADEAGSLKPRRVMFRRLLLNRIHNTVVPSQTLLRIAWNQFRLTPNKVTFIPNGIDLSNIQPRRCPDTRRALGAGDQTFLVGFIGHLRSEKALHVLIQAFAAAKLPNSRLVFLGDGPCRTELTSLVSVLGIADAVHFAGHMADPSSYLGAFDLLAMSSATEQMPMAILEAMAYGLPVISTDVGDCAVMLGTAQPPVIVPSGDVPAYAAALKALVDSPDLRSRLGVENRKRCLALYAFKKMLNSYAALYERALQSPLLTAAASKALSSSYTARPSANRRTAPPQ